MNDNMDLRTKQIEEAKKRMTMLNILPEVIEDFTTNGRVYKSTYAGILYWLNDEDAETVKAFEEEYGCLVYHCIECSYRMTDGSVMKFFDMLYVSSETSEWASDRRDLKDGYAYVNTVGPYDEEIGSIALRPLNGGVARVA